VIAFAVLAAVFALPLRGLLRAPGPPMEEGFMLVFPERVLRGDIPNRDFLHLYGPGSLWALAGAFKVFGVSLLTERLFGLAQQIAIVVSVYAIARRFDRVLAATGAAIAALVLIPFGLTALAWVGAVGLGLGGVAAGLEAHARQGSAHAGRWCVASGLLFGLALTFRLDLVIAVGLSAVVLARGLPREQRIRLFAGLGVAIAPYAVHLATAGPGNVWRGMVLDPVFHLRGGRSLPIPPSWSRLDGFLQRAGALQQLTWPIPAPRTSQQLFLWFFLLLFAIALLVVLAVRALRTEPGSLQSIALLAVACFSAGILPQALQRVDSAHFAWVGCVPFGFLPIAIFRVARGWFPRVPVRRLTLAASAAALAVVVVVIPAFTITRYTDYSLQTFGRHRHSYEITHGGRTFYYGKPDRAEAARQVIAAAAQIARPGQRLFVGPVNLRKTPYSDAYLYYMLPSLRPATYYIEMDPGVANAEDSGLDADLAASDIVILSAIWDDWDEPNDSRLTGSGKAERVLARDFCLVGEYLRLYRLYRRCA
jgi:4-amino-4-deoxy-L-arabinose transferase-like glycosyltransferase